MSRLKNLGVKYQPELTVGIFKYFETKYKPRISC